MQPKHILFYTDTPLLGGAENQMYLLAKFLPKDRYSVTLACSNYQNLNGWCQQFMDLGIQVQRLRVLHKHDPRHFFYLKKLIPQFNLLHLHIWNPASCRYALLAAKNFPVIITEHDPFPLSGFKGWLKKKLTKHVKRILVTSRAAKNLVCEQEPSWEAKVSVVPNGIDIEEFRKEARLVSRMEFRRSILGNELNKKIILCVAELHERKGQKYLIDAISRLSQNFPDIKLVFVGEGSSRKYYEKLARPLGNLVAILGRRRDVGKLMASSDIFVLPSVREAFGLVLLEASVAGIPVVASNIGGIPEIIKDSVTGILVTPGNAGELTQALKKYLENPSLASKLASAAQKKVSEKFHAKEMAMKTAEVYDAIL